MLFSTSWSSQVAFISPETLTIDKRSDARGARSPPAPKVPHRDFEARGRARVTFGADGWTILQLYLHVDIMERPGGFYLTRKKHHYHEV
jgi:hypothetical protein